MRGIRGGGLNAIAFAVAAATATILADSSAQAASVKDIFEKYKLLGTFSYDCTKPADKKNLYYVNRVVDADHVERDEMIGPETRSRVIMLDKAEELRPNEIKFSGSIVDGPSSVTVVWHIESNKMLQWESTHDGKPIVRDGVFLDTQYKMPFLNRCGN
jgi:hypothetical protein